jgi:hypothetical protein
MARAIEGPQKRNLKDFNNSIPDFLTGINLEDFFVKKNKIPQAFLTPVPNNLARSNPETVDFVNFNGRILVYPKNQEDDKAYLLLKDGNIPQFPREPAPNPNITVVKVPRNAWPLDTTDFPEQGPIAPAGTGAIEIMKKLGSLLQKIKLSTKQLPKNFSLSQVAFITGVDEFIMLVPPYSFSSDIKLQDIVKKIESELATIDPYNPHEKQIEALKASLYTHKK